MKVNDYICGFTVKRIVDVVELQATMIEMEHQKTHLRLAWLKRDEENKTFGIAFKTLPNDDTGVFHILEHSVLCGSQKYPVKEPFVELMKNSMNTFLNALTFPDKTFYPISSKNDKDFMNLTKVYLDAVFQPLIYQKKEIFLQEGWHIELGEKNQYKGVVFNEMKGSMSSPDTIMYQELTKRLFKDTCYRYVSGGDPVSIPTLSYEQFLSCHQKYYSPSNAYVFLDGNVQIEKVLELLDQEYLSNIKVSQEIDGPALQVPIKVPGETVLYEIGKDEKIENKYRVAWGQVIGTYDRQEDLMALRILSDVLCGNNQAPLSKLILSQGLGENVYISVNDGTYQNWCQIEVDNFQYEHLDDIRQLIFNELRHIVVNGIDHHQLEASLANLEFQMKERNYDQYPQGIIFGFQVLESWLYGGLPEAHLQFGEMFDSLRSKIDEGYFEKLIEDIFLNNPHSCEVVLKPSHTLGKKRRQEEMERLQSVLANMTSQEKQKIQLEQKYLDEYQNKDDRLEDLQKLPRLSLEDIQIDVEHIPTVVDKKDGMTTLKHLTNTNGIHYDRLYFKINHLSIQELSLLSLITELLGRVPTEKYSVEDIAQKTRILCGAMQFYVTDFEKKDGNYDVYLCASMSTLEKNEKEAMSLLLEILTKSIFKDEKMIQDILKQKLTNLKQSITSNGHRASMRRVLAQVSDRGVIEEHIQGIAYYQYLKFLDKHFSIDKLSKNVQKVFQQVLFYNNLTFSFTGLNDMNSNELVTLIKRQLAYRAESMEDAIIQPWGKRKEGIIIPSDIAYASSGAFVQEKSHSQVLAARIVSLAYLWNVVRIQGGAYGTGMISRDSGWTCCYSYRDPDGKDSLKKYQVCGQFLNDFIQEKPDLTGYIIGTISTLSPLIMPYNIGQYGDAFYFRGVSDEDRKQKQEDILHTTYDQLKEAALQFEQAFKESGTCLIGGINQLDQCELDEKIIL